MNRLAEPGEALKDPVALAETIASFPQTCMRSDRLSAYEQCSLEISDALANEFRRGSDVLASGESFEGGRRFVEGAGRHGAFEKK